MANNPSLAFVGLSLGWAVAIVHKPGGYSEFVAGSDKLTIKSGQRLIDDEAFVKYSMVKTGHVLMLKLREKEIEIAGKRSRY